MKAMINALGIVSETRRPDRDNYVIVFLERMIISKQSLYWHSKQMVHL